MSGGFKLRQEQPLGFIGYVPKSAPAYNILWYSLNTHTIANILRILNQFQNKNRRQKQTSHPHLSIKS